MLSYGFNKIDDTVIYYLKTTGSTNRVVTQLAGSHEGQDVIVLADHQTSGRGKGDRVWHSNPGDSLCFSMLLHPQVDLENIYQITLIAAVAVHKAIEHISGLKTQIKWPNDLMCGCRKICGILSELALNEEGSLDHVTVGIGINVSQQNEQFASDVSHRAASLKTETGLNVDRLKLFLLIREIMKQEVLNWEQNGFGDCYSLISQNSGSIGRYLSISTGFNSIDGHVTDICSDGSILIKDKIGVFHQIYCGEVLQ